MGRFYQKLLHFVGFGFCILPSEEQSGIWWVGGPQLVYAVNVLFCCKEWTSVGMTQFRLTCNLLFLFLLLAVAAAAAFVLYNTNKLRATRPLYTPQDNYSPESEEPTRILYLTQTEECLPDHLRSALGNSSACQCDVVLSYKNVCKDSSLPNVRYLFNCSTTWTTGRNLLFTSNIHNRNGEYLYFILMDDDLHLRWAKTTRGNRFKNTNPWRSFEDFIKRVQPAVAALELRERILNRKLANRRNKKCSTVEEYILTLWYDAAFNAFHYKAVQHSLPYWDKMENLSWYISAVHNIIWNEIVFRGQVVLHKDLIADNQQHRPYPRKITLREFCQHSWKVWGRGFRHSVKTHLCYKNMRQKEQCM